MTHRLEAATDRETDGPLAPSGSSPRATRIAVTIIIAIALAAIVTTVIASRSSAPASVLAGDFPAFYGAGEIASSGDWDQLYDIDRQVESQEGLHVVDGNVWFFAYPPQVAWLYAPLSRLEFAWANLLHSLVMAAALTASVLLARPMLPWLRGREVVVVAACLTFWPMFRAILGGSNTAMTLLIVVSAWRLVHEDRHVFAGLVLSTLWYKPQFAVPLIGLFLVARYGRVVVGAAAGSAVFLVSGMLLLGVSWVRTWLEAATEFGALDAEVNGHSAISAVGFSGNLFGVGLSPATAIAWMMALGVAAFLCVLWWRSDREHLDVLLAITVPGVLFLSPHAMSHEGALVVLTVGVAIGTWAHTSWRPWVGAIWALGATQAFIKPLGFSPGFVMLLVVGLWLLSPIRRPEEHLGFRW